MLEAEAIVVFREFRAVADFDFTRGGRLSHRARERSIREIPREVYCKGIRQR
jgi:hypothetical protein